MNTETLIEFAKAWTSMGWAVTQQVEEIMAEGPDSDANPNAVAMAIDRLKEFEGDDGVDGILAALEEWLSHRIAPCLRFDPGPRLPEGSPDDFQAELEHEEIARQKRPITVTVRYWIGTRECEGRAINYTGAMLIASRNQNAYTPRFYDHAGVRLHDLGNCLAYEPDDAGDVIVYC